MYEPKTTRLDMEEDQYAVFFQEMKHGTQKNVELLLRPFRTFPDGDPPKLIIKEGEDKPQVEGSTTVVIDMEKVDLDAVNDAVTIGQIKEWSFGPVDQSTLDNLPKRFQVQLRDECNRLYGEAAPLPQGGAGN